MDQPHHICAWQAGYFPVTWELVKRVFFLFLSQHAIVEQCDVKFELNLNALTFQVGSERQNNFASVYLFVYPLKKRVQY